MTVRAITQGLMALRWAIPSLVTVRRSSTQLKSVERFRRSSEDDVSSAGPAATVLPRESMATTNGTMCDFVESRINPPTAMSATKVLSSAMIRQFRSRVMRLPYLSSHSRRAAR